VRSTDSIFGNRLSRLLFELKFFLFATSIEFVADKRRVSARSNAVARTNFGGLPSGEKGGYFDAVKRLSVSPGVCKHGEVTVTLSHKKSLEFLGNSSKNG
jgi:hypothetical protein